VRIKCERCGGWVDESYTHVVHGQCVCVLCGFQLKNPEWNPKPIDREGGEDEPGAE
jgi:ribosomal protein L37E